MILLASCGVTVQDLDLYSSTDSRLLFYIQLSSASPSDIEFTISSIEFQSSGGGWVNALEGPVELNSTALVKKQVLLREAFVEPGVYENVKIVVEAASIMSKGGGRASLALPPEGGTVTPFHMTMEPGGSYVVTLIWDPDKSVRKRVVFDPVIKVEPQKPAAFDFLLFISNSKSNYVTVIDRGLGMVIGAVTVGRRPMGMTLNDTFDRLYVVNSGSYSISVVNTAHYFITDTVFLTTGIDPTDIVFISDKNNIAEGKLYVINRTSNDVTVISTRSMNVVRTIDVGDRPSAIAVDKVRREVYVANELSNEVSVISTDTDSVVAVVSVDSRPMGLMLGDDKLYVLNEGSMTISIISTSTRAVLEVVSLAEPPRRGHRGFNGRLFVANSSSNTISIFNAQNAFITTLPVGAGPIGLAGDEDRNLLYVTNGGDDTVTVIEALGERVVKELDVGKSPYGAVLLRR